MASGSSWSRSLPITLSAATRDRRYQRLASRFGFYVAGGSPW